MSNDQRGPVDRATYTTELEREAKALGIPPGIARRQRMDAAVTGLRGYRRYAGNTIVENVREAYATGATVEEIAADSGLEKAQVEAWIQGRDPAASGTIGDVNVICRTPGHGIHVLPDAEAERLVYAYAAALQLAAAEVDRTYPAVLNTAATMPTCPVEVLALIDDGAEFAEAVRERVAARERAQTSA